MVLFRSSDEIKVKVQYFEAISIHFMSNVWIQAHFPPRNFVIWWKIGIFDTKHLIPRYSTTFQLPNHLYLQEMNKIQLYSYGEADLVTTNYITPKHAPNRLFWGIFSSFYFWGPFLLNFAPKICLFIHQMWDAISQMTEICHKNK